MTQAQINYLFAMRAITELVEKGLITAGPIRITDAGRQMCAYLEKEGLKPDPRQIADTATAIIEKYEKDQVLADTRGKEN